MAPPSQTPPSGSRDSAHAPPRPSAATATATATAATSTRTRERLRAMEEENDRLKSAYEKERAKNSLTELKREERKTSSTPRKSNAGLFRAVCSTDLLFLIDTTSSMGSYIEAAKQQVRDIVADITRAFLNEAEVRTAVVGYKDHSDSPNIQFLDFTPSADNVRSFLGGLKATGGADLPEDVLGGLNRALNASWRHETRCLIHIADAPPHGRGLHDLVDSWDSYITPGSEPHRLTHAPLLSQLIAKKINYALLKINNYTDRMAFTFAQAYATEGADCSLHSSNKYQSLMPKHNGTRGLLFLETNLGVSFDILRRAVVSAVTASATASAIRKTADSERTAVEGRVPDVVEENDPPQWDTEGWLPETLVVEGYSLDVVHGANTLNDMLADDENITMSVLQLSIRKRQLPFSQGALRKASYAQTVHSSNRYVVKSDKKRMDQSLAELAEDMRCQALCKSFALAFNATALLTEDQSIDFLVTTCFKGKTGGISLEYFMEGAMEGRYIKYNGNNSYIHKDMSNPSNVAAQAFSHFTFERSKGRFLVCDLQGVGNLLTDPAIHTKDPNRFRRSLTNLNEEGFKFFFSTHECNDICRKLGLKSTKEMLRTGVFTFRETWPVQEPTVCCSNKLCGKILRKNAADTSRKFPGYHWCDGCFPQLDQFMEKKKVCVAAAKYHTFDVSNFFYEAQGRSTPRKCPEHRTDEVKPTNKVGVPLGGAMAVPIATMAKGDAWEKLKTASVYIDKD